MSNGPFHLSSEDIGLFRKRSQQRVLLVGYTPELASMATHIVSPRTVEDIADPYLDSLIDTGVEFLSINPYALCEHNIGKFDVIIGDGILNTCGPENNETMPQLFNALRSKLTSEREAKMVFRVYLNQTQQGKEPLGKILLTRGDDFEIFKWRIAMFLANPFVSFGDLFSEVMKHWPNDNMDFYRYTEGRYLFPSFLELPMQQRIMEVDVPSSYPLAGSCPVVTWTF